MTTGLGLSDHTSGVMDGTFLADHLPNWLVSDLIIRREHAAEVTAEGDYWRGTRIGLTMVLDKRDSAWRVYASLRETP